MVAVDFGVVNLMITLECCLPKLLQNYGAVVSGVVAVE